MGEASQADVELRVLYDGEALKGFREGFGFSCWVEGKNVLFDVGGDLATLMFNVQRAAVDLKYVKRIVLSHEHGDHVGGIQIIDRCGEVEVFALRSFSRSFKRWLASHPNVRLHEVDEAKEICRDVYTTGELGGSVKEQSLIVRTPNGLTVVTGCAHPGLENILRLASSFGEIHAVVGGFHGFSGLEALLGIRLIVPCHCTARKEEILRLYPQRAIRGRAGLKIPV
jgi:7,8-dihydropterin-6-yl-methyl-4-(beta-D-ribofuranosyl)aminobenzene 5'-phosphate synthase